MKFFKTMEELKLCRALKELRLKIERLDERVVLLEQKVATRQGEEVTHEGVQSKRSDAG